MTYDRQLLLAGPKRNQVLDLWEVEQYGTDGFEDPGYVSLYGLAPAAWFDRGVRILGRTAVECTRDRLADLMGSDIASWVGRFEPTARSMVIDLFAGSANTLYWLQRHQPGSRAVGFELDDDVFEATRGNLAILGLDIEIQRLDFEAGLRTLRPVAGERVSVFVAPPWGDALSASTGLDLRRTEPPIAEVLDVLERTLSEQRVLVAVQTYEILDPESLAAVVRRFSSWTLRTYDINRPGANHGLLLGELRGP